MKRGKKLLKILAGILLALALVLVSLITTQDKTRLHEAGFYKEWKESIREVDITTGNTADTLRAGWAKINITPGNPGPMAGYGNRRASHSPTSTIPFLSAR